ncbi:MAG: hypothetical protein KJO98_11120 [Rhodothermia bacterium]|nr:hypothetical protein [Rhodothermia bacterium]
MLFLAGPLVAQELQVDTLQAASPGAELRVYLDCDDCDFDHIRREITFVSYVRDPEQADVHVFITNQRTGNDGRQYLLSFLGRGGFGSVEYTFERTVGRDATNDETRDAVNAAIRLGLVPYVVQKEGASNFVVGYSGSADVATDQQSRVDPWRHWVFTAYVGDIELDLESNRTVFDSRWGLFADHVSEDWKLRLRPYFNFDLTKIERDDEPDVRSSISRHGFDSYAIRSLGSHWSAGIFGSYVTRNDRNIRHRAEMAPGIEYSVLPYDQATRRAITVVYQVQLAYVDYFDKTIFDQTKESLVSQELSASVAIRQPWGEIFGGLEGSHYFHDFSKRRAEFFGVLSVRLLEGLSLRVQGEFEMIRDQLSLPLGDASLEDILLRQRELATDFEFSGSIAITYTFGSNFTNVVNTRF